MKVQSWCVMAIVLVIFIGGNVWAQSKADMENLKMVYIEDYPPLSWEENGVVTGISIDVLTEALQNRMGIQVTHNVYPWKRAQVMVETGEADGFITLPTDQRRAYTNVCEETVFSADFTLFVNPANPRIEGLQQVRTIADLQEFKVGHIIGSGWAEQAFKGMDVDWAATSESNMRKLAAGRIDAFVINSFVGNWLIKTLELKGKVIEVPEAILRPVPYHLMINTHSRYADILPTFDTTIKEMKADGSLETIFAKYR